MSQFPSEAIEAALANVEADEKRLVELATDMVSAYDGALYPFDFFAVTTLNRSVALSSGFCTMIRAQNLICAGALVRLQLDNALRFFAGFIVDEPHEFFMKVLEGKHIDRMKYKDGNRMTDRYLVTQLADEYPGIEEVYEKASNYVHLSETHILSTLSKIDRESGSMKISSRDPTFPDEVYIDTIKTFRACTFIFARYVKRWISHPKRLLTEKVAQMRQVLESKQRES